MVPITQIALDASENPVKVTIFRSSTAEITRTFSVELKASTIMGPPPPFNISDYIEQAGKNLLQISNISNYIDKESPRIYGLGKDAHVFDISCDPRLRGAPNVRQNKNAEALKNVVATRKILEAEKTIRVQESDVLNDAARSCLRDSPAQLDAFMDNFVRRKRDATEAIMDLEEQIARLDEEIWVLKNTHKGNTSTVIVATVLAKQDYHAEFQLTYLVTHASWLPYYDLHAITSDGRTSSEVSLAYYADITQSTGEDWNDTTLTLSTATSQTFGNLSIPLVDSLKVSPVHELRSQNENQLCAWQPSLSMSDVASHPMGFVKTAQEKGRDLPPNISNYERPGRPSVEDVQESEDEIVTQGGDFDNNFANTTFNQGTLSLAYRVDGAASLPSDGLVHKVLVAVLDFSADIKYVCVPQKTAATFIEGTVKNMSEYELLKGTVSVFMDDEFVTKTTLGPIGVNETFNCVLGVDSALKISYHTDSKTVEEPPRSFAEPTKTTTRTFRTTVTNGHQYDVSGLVVRNSLPLGDDEAHFKVKLRKPDGLAQAKDGDEVMVKVPLDSGRDQQDVKVRWSKVEDGKGGEKAGMYEWVCSIPAREKVTLQAELEIRVLSGAKWTETAQYWV